MSGHRTKAIAALGAGWGIGALTWILKPHCWLAAIVATIVTGAALWWMEIDDE